MILKVIAYGDPLLRRESVNIEENYSELSSLLDNMFETMYASSGVGLAAPQIGLNINLFIIDSSRIDNYKEGKKMVFINPVILEKTGKKWTYEEGCLSLPKLREDVDREEKVLISYLDEHFKPHKEWFDGLNARVIQHEYDHLIGVLFIDHISPLKRKLHKKRLNDIITGSVSVDYPMRFYRKSAKIH